MIKETIAKIEEKVQHISGIKSENKEHLLSLLSTLKCEIDELAKTESAQAENIIGLTEISAHEATRQNKNPQRLKHSLDDLASSVEGFEVSHPTLVGTVNALCVMLSNLGI